MTPRKQNRGHREKQTNLSFCSRIRHWKLLRKKEPSFLGVLNEVTKSCQRTYQLSHFSTFSQLFHSPHRRTILSMTPRRIDTSCQSTPAYVSNAKKKKKTKVKKQIAQSFNRTRECFPVHIVHHFFHSERRASPKKDPFTI